MYGTADLLLKLKIAMRDSPRPDGLWLVGTCLDGGGGGGGQMAP